MEGKKDEEKKEYGGTEKFKIRDGKACLVNIDSVTGHSIN